VTVVGIDACRGKWLAVALEDGHFAGDLHVRLADRSLRQTERDRHIAAGGGLANTRPGRKGKRRSERSLRSARRSTRARTPGSRRSILACLRGRAGTRVQPEPPQPGSERATGVRGKAKTLTTMPPASHWTANACFASAGELERRQSIGQASAAAVSRSTTRRRNMQDQAVLDRDPQSHPSLTAGISRSVVVVSSRVSVVLKLVLQSVRAGARHSTHRFGPSRAGARPRRLPRSTTTGRSANACGRA
jgi:hypothetical protein